MDPPPFPWADDLRRLPIRNRPKCGCSARMTVRESGGVFVWRCFCFPRCRGTQPINQAKLDAWAAKRGLSAIPWIHAPRDSQSASEWMTPITRARLPAKMPMLDATSWIQEQEARFFTELNRLRAMT